MKQLCVGAAAAVLLGTAFVRADKTYPCGTFISVEPDGSGGIKIAEPDRMQCAVSEEMVVAFVNKDLTKPYRFQIRDIGCKDQSNKGKDPTKRFVKKPIDVDPGATRVLRSGLFNSPPAVLDRDKFTDLKCADGSFLYKYVIRVSSKGDDENGKIEIDPDLEVSPPPNLEVKGTRKP